VLGMGGWADHAYRGCRPNSRSCFTPPDIIRNVSAVTGACMAISREAIEKIGPFDEKYTIAYSDIDLCLRAMEKGYENIYTPFVKLIHLESKTRGTFVPGKDFLYSKKRFLPYWMKGDPYYNINLQLFGTKPELNPAKIHANTPLQQVKEAGLAFSEDESTKSERTGV
jgi:O-antigen biosynthesis protein